jgi:hypothetical protein
LQKNKLELPEIKSERFETDMVLSFGLEPYAVDILRPECPKSVLDKYDVEVLKKILKSGKH